MIIRRKPREASGSASGQSHGAQKHGIQKPADGNLRGSLEGTLEESGTLVIPRHGNDAGKAPWDSAKVVPLHPRTARDVALDDDDEPGDEPGNKPGLAEDLGGLGDDPDESHKENAPLSSRTATRRPVAASMPKTGAEQAAFEEAEATNDLLVKALRSADLGAAETLFGRLTGLSPVSTLAVLYDPKGEDLALACRALGMDQLQFVSVYILSRKLGLGEEALAPQDLARLVALFEASDLEEARTRLKGLLDGKSGPAARPFRHD